MLSAFDRADALRLVERPGPDPGPGRVRARPWPRVDRVFSLADSADVFRHLEAAEQFGEVVLRLRST